MVKFGFKEYVDNYPNWSKHHKTVGLLVKRVFADGKDVLPKDEKLKALVAANEDVLKPKHGKLYKDNKLVDVTDYYLPLQNLEYKEADIEYYSVGAMNTTQTIHMRLTFLLEYDKFILEHSFKSSGSYAMNFRHVLDGIDFVEDTIEEVVSQGKRLAEVGIEKGVDEDYRIVIVSRVGEITDVEIEKRELVDSLIAVEVYQFDHTIDEPVAPSFDPVEGDENAV